MKKKEDPSVLLLGNVKDDGSKSMEIVGKEYEKKFNYKKVLNPKKYLSHKISKLIVYPMIILLNRGYDVYHIVDHSYGHLSFFLPKSKIVITCHDLIPLLYPKKISFIGRLIFKFYLLGLKRAKIILSDLITKKQLIDLLNIKKSKIRVFDHYVDLSNFKEIRGKESLKRKHQIKGDFVIMAMGSEFYKNPKRVLKAFKIVNERYSGSVLLKVGGLSKEEEEISKKLGIKEKILEKKNVSQKSLVELYNCSDLFVFPSIYTGFARPPLEAMACGTPTIISKLPSFPEIKRKGSVVRVNPYSIDEISKSIILVKKDFNLRKKLVEEGKKEIENFKESRDNNSLRVSVGAYKEIYNSS